ncbi:MBL fold metallo-hydrolase [Siccirubricoccus phaeus]|uniref:MBL fold metallo-hydrolase n=1 Tax=Siccirubricoccus phaeus TaxID=2595053 RepID=UPI0011F3C9AD|nr:MBL fold metallo-hydrolase [Siccirubricoccus phaeus]
MGTSFRLGDLTIHRIIEEERPLFDPLEFFPTLTKEVLEENRSWLEPTSIDPATGKLILCIQSYIVETPHHKILVDTCVGNHKDRPTRPFWHQKTDETWQRNLAGAGFRPEDIDYVMCTHLHVDHVGWNTQLKDGRWVPTFPKARYIFGAKEYAYWEAEHKRTPNPVIADSVLPIVEAGQAELVATDHAMNDHIRLIPTPGHTPDHYAVELGKGDTLGVLTGDLIHSPIQARYPELGMRADVDSAQGAVTRRKFLECHCDSGRLMCTGHFASPSTGHFTRWGDGFRFMPAEG